MSRLKLDPDILGLSSILERKIGVHVKDCFKEEDIIYVVVNPGELGKAVGKNGVNIKKIQNQLKRRIRIIEYRDSVESFVKNIIYPVNVSEIVLEGDVVEIRDPSRSVKSGLIGRGGKNLVVIQRAVKRFFPGVEVKVV